MHKCFRIFVVNVYCTAFLTVAIPIKFARSVTAAVRASGQPGATCPVSQGHYYYRNGIFKNVHEKTSLGPLHDLVL